MRKFTFSKAAILRYATLAILILLILGFIATAFLFVWYGRDLPKPDQIRRTSGLSTIIYDRNGKVLYDIYKDENRVPVGLSEVPDHLKNATVAIEDKDFYKHKGFSIPGLLRGLIISPLIKGRTEGGSTLTQQLVKNALLSNERSVPRKIKEFILSVEIERRYSKDEILQMYLNEVPYGGTAAGIEVASQDYFGKRAKDLTLSESAVLAGIPQRPSFYSPYTGDSKAYIARGGDVLRRMREDGYITKEEEEAAKKELPGLSFQPQRKDILAPHFVMYVREQLLDRFGEKSIEEDGLRVFTTLDYELQEKSQQAVFEEVEKAKGLQVGNGAALAMDPNTGEILVMIGSKDYFATDEDGNYNVTTALRQPGSTLKPITYAAAFKKGFTPSSIIMDVPTKFPGGAGEKEYEPKNYDGKFRGPIQLRQALGNSINMSAVKLLSYVGVEDLLSTAFNMGLTSLAPTQDNVNRFGLSVTLGGGEVTLLELVNAFGVFATNGQFHEPVSILKVTDSSGKILYQDKPTKGKTVLGEDVSFLISNILSDNNARIDVFGPNSWLNIDGVAVKTGTTDDKKDNWTVGYVPSIVIGAWVGNNDNTQMSPTLASGVTGAAPIWNRIMQEALKKYPKEAFKKPDNIVELDIDAYGGGLPKEGYPIRKEFYKKGTEPTTQSAIYKKIKISKSTGKLANEVEVASGNYEEKEFIVFAENDPLSTDGRNRYQEGINTWLSTQSDSKFHPPTDNSDGSNNSVVVELHEPDQEKRYDTNDITIQAKGVSLNGISKLEIEIDGGLKKTVNGDSINEVFNMTTGPHTVKITAFDNQGNNGSREVKIGVKSDWQTTPTPTL
ncbi:penicillin-binding protein [Candidatus Gottesmanbacteria bacterium]|nr:penicillin-binding protein [Candidatus Gottesmanbacteria bacterium]